MMFWIDKYQFNKEDYNEHGYDTIEEEEDISN
jgi:hypothetical protein